MSDQPKKPRLPRKPRLTRQVLAGLNDALSRMEADDLTDQPGDDAKAFHAALEWLQRMYEYRAARNLPC